MQGIIQNYDPIRQMYIFGLLNRIFNVDESRPLIVPYEYIQPVEVPILKHIQNTNYNHKLYNLIQKTTHELSPSTEDQKIIRALELLWSLRQTKYITRLLAKLITSSDTIHNHFTNGFFAKNDPQ